MPGSLDDGKVKLINMNEIALAVMINKDGTTDITSQVTKEVAASTLRNLADIIERGDGGV